MKSVLIANSIPDETRAITQAIKEEFNASAISSPRELREHPEDFDLVLLDSNFTEHSGLDFLEEILKDSHLPVFMITQPDDAGSAMEAIRMGAHNYIVKVDGYQELLTFLIKEAIEKFNELRRMKEAVIALKKRVNELEGQLGIAGKGDDQTSSPKTKAGILEEIISRFKHGEINLPSLPQINFKFREMVGKGTNLREVADLLKRDVAISSKLISVSNSPHYRGVTENKTLAQAIGRLGLNTTRNYVDAISNRALYTTANERFVEFIEKLWEHSLSCAYASQILSETLKLKLPDDPFTLGLLHDIGKLILLQVVGELEIKGQLQEEIDRPELFSLLEENHGSFGAGLLRRWRFPAGYTHVALYHANLEEADPISKELLVVHFANLLVKSLGYDFFQQEELDIEGAESAQLLKLAPETIAEVREQVSAHVGEMRGYFNDTGT